MSDQQQSHDEFGGFGESDNQTFNRGLQEQSAAQGQQGNSSQAEGQSHSGFISYLQPEVVAEEETTSSKKIGLIAIITLAVLAMLWFVLPSSKKSSDKDNIAIATDTMTDVEKAIEKDKQIINQTREQDSLALVQDYLAKMQLAQGKSIGNNERTEQNIEEPITDQVPVEEKAPIKKVAPPDPVPAKSYPEYNDKAQGNNAPSIQKDQAQKEAPKVAQQPKPQPMPKVVAPKKIILAKKDQVRPKVTSNPGKPKKDQQQVFNETFVETPKKSKEQRSKVVNTTSSGTEYSVQVMASISKGEADAALKKLKSKGVSSAFLSKRSLNGKTWYRVRFGGFSERNEAESAAKKAGYVNAWVERVK